MLTFQEYLEDPSSLLTEDLCTQSSLTLPRILLPPSFTKLTASWSVFQRDHVRPLLPPPLKIRLSCYIFFLSFSVALNKYKAIQVWLFNTSIRHYISKIHERWCVPIVHPTPNIMKDTGVSVYTINIVSIYTINMCWTNISVKTTSKQAKQNKTEHTCLSFRISCNRGLLICSQNQQSPSYQTKLHSTPKQHDYGKHRR